MRRNAAMLTACTLALCATARAGAPIPADRRISARVTGAIAAPTTQPMHMPTDVAIDAKQRIVVADGANDRVLRFLPDGQLDSAITESVGVPLRRPVGVSTDEQGRLWIADSGNGRVIILPPEGEPASFTLPEAAHAPEPTDLAVSADGSRAYIVDNNNHRLLIRDNATGEMRAMGRFGEALGQFRWPFMAVIGADGYVLITEAIGARVQRLSPREQWAGQVGRWGVELGQLYRPKGLAVDASGRIYVGDSTLNVVQVFGPRGDLVGVLTDGSGNLLRFQHPMGMCFDGRGRLLVVELRADRVATVEMGTTASAPAEGRR